MLAITNSLGVRPPLQLLIACVVALLGPTLTHASLTKGPSVVRSYSTPFDYGNESYKGVTIDPDGTSYLVGDTTGPLQNDYSSTLSKVFVHRRAKDGSLIWETVLKDPSYAQYATPNPFASSFKPVTAISSLDSNTLLIIYERLQPYQLGYARYFDYWMAFVSKADGSVQGGSQLRGWTQEGSDRAYCIVPNGKGAFLLAENGSIFYYYNESGSLTWQMPYPFDNWWSGDATKTFCFAPNGQLIAAGAANFGGSGQQIPAVAAFSPAGEKLWEEYFPGSSAQPFRAVAVDSSGSVYVANRIAQGPAIRKLDAAGSQLWGFSYSGIDEPDRIAHVRGHLLLFNDDLNGRYAVLDGAGTVKASGNLDLNASLANVEAVFVNRQGHVAAAGNNRRFGYGNGDAIVETFSFTGGAKEPQSIDFVQPENQVFQAGKTFSLVASSSAGLPVSFVSLNTNVVVVAGNVATIRGAGTVTLTATNRGDATFSAGGASRTVVVHKADQSLTFSALNDQAFAPNRTFNLFATSSSGLPVRFSSPNSNVVTIVGTVATLRGGGSATIFATQPGNNNFYAASAVQQTLVVTPGDQNITFTQPPAQVFAPNKTFTLSATANSRLPVSFESANSNVVSIVGNVATIRGAGSVEITARQAGNASYAAAPEIRRTVVVSRAGQTIRAFAAIPVQVYAPGRTVTVAVPAATSRLPVTLSVVSGPATIAGNTVTLTGAGTVVLAANQAGDANFNAAREVTTSFVVNKQNVVAGNIVLSNTSHTFDGTAKGVTVATVPPGLATRVTYNGSTNLPVNAGTYNVAVTINDANYQGSRGGIKMTIR